MTQRILLVLFLMGAVGSASAQPGSTLVPGPHRVGVRSILLRDPTRTILPDSGRGTRRCRIDSSCALPPPRIVPVLIWYPALPGGARLATYRDVVMLADSAGSDALNGVRERTLSIHRYAARKYATAASTPIEPVDTTGVATRALAARTPALLRARAAPGRFPLVVFAGGAYHSADENVALWAHLASHGYVVASFPSVGVEGSDLPDDALGLETMARDVELVIAELRGAPNVDPRRIASMGFSFGGAAALVAASRNAWIDAIAALDASLIAARHLGAIRASPLFSPERVRVPLLELHRADTTVDLSLIQSLAGEPRHSVELSGLDHVDFNSYVLLYGPLLRARPGTARDSAIAAKAGAYAGMVTTIRTFFDATVKGDTAAARELDRLLSPTAGVWRSMPDNDVRMRRWP